MLQLSKFITFKYLEVILNEKSIYLEDISKITKGRKMIGCVNSLWRDKKMIKKSYSTIIDLLWMLQKSS